jgi:hypothetical protein
VGKKVWRSNLQMVLKKCACKRREGGEEESSPLESRVAGKMGRRRRVRPFYKMGKWVPLGPNLLKAKTHVCGSRMKTTKKTILFVEIFSF